MHRGHVSPVAPLPDDGNHFFATHSWPRVPRQDCADLVHHFGHRGFVRDVVEHGQQVFLERLPLRLCSLHQRRVHGIGDIPNQHVFAHIRRVSPLIAFCKHYLGSCRHPRRIARTTRRPRKFHTGTTSPPLETLGDAFGQPDRASTGGAMGGIAGDTQRFGNSATNVALSNAVEIFQVRTGTTVGESVPDPHSE